MGDFHKDSIGHNNHAVTANPDDAVNGYEWLDLMTADTQFQVAENINKFIRVERRNQGDPANPSIWWLVSVDPAVYTDVAGDIVEVDTFLELRDTPEDYSGNAGKATQVNAAEDALEFGQQLRPQDNPAFAELTVGGTGPAATDTSLDLQGSNKAMLANRLTTAERDALTPLNGMVIYNTTIGAMESYADGAWRNYKNIDEFLELSDTPSSYVGAAGKLLAVNSGSDGVEFTDTKAGDLTITGDLTVQGTTTTIDSETLVVEDNNIEVGAVPTPTDVTADGGGLTLKGTTDKIIAWANATKAWTFNQIALFSDTMSIGGLTAPATDVSLDLLDPTKAFRLNHGTTAQRDAITPSEAMLYYNTDTQDLESYNSTIWESAAGGDVVGASSAVDNSIPTWNGTSGKVIKDSGKVSINPTSGDINVAGNMILGTPGPSGAGVISTRDDASTLQLSGSVTPGSAAYLIMDSSTKSGSFIATYGDVNAPAPVGAAFLVRFADDGGIANALVVDSNLNTGIGKTVPSTAKLDVEQASGATAFKAGTALTQWAVGTFDGGNNYLLSQGTAIPAVIGTQNNAPLGFFTNNTGRGQIAADGTWSINENLGVGTPSPTEKLEVSSDAVGGGRISVDETSAGGANNPGYMIHNNGSFKGGMFYKETTNTVEIFNNLGPQIIINEWGVGINREPAINEQLSVNGIANFTGGLHGDGSLISETDTLILGNAGNGGIGSVAVKDLKFGIGTFDPAYELDVIGTARIDSWLRSYANITVGTVDPISPNISVELQHTDKSIQLNNVSTASRDGYATPVEGMFHNNTDLRIPEVYDNDKWKALGSESIVYVKTAADFPAPIAFTIFLEPNTRYVGDNHATTITLPTLVNIQFAENSRIEYMSLSMSGVCKSSVDFEFNNSLIYYTGTETLLDMPNLSGISQVNSSTFYLLAAGTLFGLDSVTANTAVIWDTIGIVGSGPGSSLGSVGGVVFSFTTGRSLFFGEGLTLHDCTQIEIDKYISIGVNTATTHITMNGTTQANIQVSGFSPIVQSNEYAFDFQAGTAFNGVTSVSGCTISDPDRVFAPGSFDYTTLGFKFLGNANIPDSTATAHILAINQAAIQTDLSVDRVQRIFANYAEASSERFTTTTWGNLQYTGNEAATFMFNSTITGTVSTGTNIPMNFFLAKNPSGLLITSVEEVSPTVVRIHTNIPHGWTTEDRIILENSSYDGQYGIFNPTSTTFEIFAVFIATSIGFPSRVLPETQASNDFSGSNRNTSLIAVVSMNQGDIVFPCVENTGNNGEWLTEDIQAIMTKV